MKSNVSSKGQGKVEVKESRCKQALFDVCDPLLPVRGHALLELAKLISCNDKEAQRHRNQILRIFQVSSKFQRNDVIGILCTLILFREADL